jgi:hypothetical protein
LVPANSASAVSATRMTAPKTKRALPPVATLVAPGLGEGSTAAPAAPVATPDSEPLPVMQVVPAAPTAAAVENPPPLVPGL